MPILPHFKLKIVVVELTTIFSVFKLWPYCKHFDFCYYFITCVPENYNTTTVMFFMSTFTFQERKASSTLSVQHVTLIEKKGSVFPKTDKLEFSLIESYLY